jgi:hypothetical protein
LNDNVILIFVRGYGIGSVQSRIQTPIVGLASPYNKKETKSSARIIPAGGVSTEVCPDPGMPDDSDPYPRTTLIFPKMAVGYAIAGKKTPLPKWERRFGR